MRKSTRIQNKDPYISTKQVTQSRVTITPVPVSNLGVLRISQNETRHRCPTGRLGSALGGVYTETRSPPVYSHVSGVLYWEGVETPTTKSTDLSHESTLFSPSGWSRDPDLMPPSRTQGVYPTQTFGLLPLTLRSRWKYETPPTLTVGPGRVLWRFSGRIITNSYVSTQREDGVCREEYKVQRSSSRSTLRITPFHTEVQ